MLVLGQIDIIHTWLLYLLYISHKGFKYICMYTISFHLN